MKAITVRFYTLWQLYLGTNRLSLLADNVEEVMVQIEDKFGSQFRERLRSHSVLLLNGYNVDKQDLRQLKLREGDILHIFPRAAGG